MKQRMTHVDIRAMCVDLNKKIAGFRLANIYDLEEKTFLLKFWKSEIGKANLVIESGQRLHTTKYEREKDSAPSAFTLKVCVLS
jgi:predicted ribosome quality control (RQC) complex YloA/Tae2 family protein